MRFDLGRVLQADRGMVCRRGPHEDAGPVSVKDVGVDPGMVECVGGRFEKEPLLRVHLAGFPLRNVEARRIV
jgi:hypothetical protein